MESPVMRELSLALDSKGLATFRFNFRGVGGSDGNFDQGKGEQEDLKSAIDTLRKWPGVKGNRVGIAGFSFGAVVTLDSLAKLKGIQSLALVAPTISAVERSRLDKFRAPVLLLAGEKDRLVPAEHLESAISTASPSLDFRVVPETDHTWNRHEAQIASDVADFFLKSL